jgi:DNA-damage-inducible protein D
MWVFYRATAGWLIGQRDRSGELRSSMGAGAGRRGEPGRERNNETPIVVRCLAMKEEGASQGLFDLQRDGHAPFEEAGKENGGRFWYARDFMGMLGYQNFSSFENAINKAIRACTSLGIPLIDVLAPIEREIQSVKQRDYKLSRFGCYLVAVNGDTKKPQVAAAQAYFITPAEAFTQHVHQVEGVERLLIRTDISEREHSLSGVVNAAGVVNYAFFQNAGYRGMYNMDLWRLRDIKGVPNGRSPLDFMGKQELAANLFRITETEAKIKNEGVRGQAALEHTAERVGQKVRSTMMEISSTRPELLARPGTSRLFKAV